MLELLFLLLPFAAGYGWYMGYQNANKDNQRHSSKMSQQYVAGLNLILTDQSDKAIEHFIDLLQVDHETIDTHLALGNLFRSRGEVDRAIRIHKNLITKENLSIDEKHLALFELSKDYMAAGLLDRAEKILLQLTEEPDYRQPALENLVSIYQQIQEWNKAIYYSHELVKNNKDKRYKKDIAHYWCEIAKETYLDERDTKSLSKAILYYQRALSEDEKCVRASISLGEIYLQQEDYESALKYFTKVVEQDMNFISEILWDIETCYQQLDREDELIQLLEYYMERKAGACVELMLAKIIAQKEGYAQAQIFLTKQLTRNPTLKGFYRLISYHIEEAEAGRAKNSLSSLQGMVGEYIQLKPKHQCSQCGFTSQSLRWVCPSCKTWGNMKPIRGLDGE